MDQTQRQWELPSWQTLWTIHA